MKINVYHLDGFKYFEAVGKDFNLYCFSITELIKQLFSIYSIDLRRYLFSAPILPIVNHSQLN